MNVFDYKPTTLKIRKWDFDEWRIDKIEKPSTNIKHIQEKKSKKKVNITKDEKEIMKQVLSMMQNKKYMLESDAIEGIKHYSKAKTRRTIRKNYVLDKYKLKRIRANGEIKDKLGITSKGFPFILVKN